MGCQSASELTQDARSHANGNPTEVLEQPGQLALTRKRCVATRKSFSSIEDDSRMKLGESTRDSASSMMNLFNFKLLCGPERILSRKVPPIGQLENFTSGLTTSCCPQAIFPQTYCAQSWLGLQLVGSVGQDFGLPVTRREPMSMDMSVMTLQLTESSSLRR